MTGYGDSLYGSDWYMASPFRVGGAELSIGIRARVVKPVSSVPPVMDSISVGLAQRFDWLQQGIQVFSLFNKIEYAKGSDLDDHWGQIYDLPRLTGETDEDYRTRLQNYVRVLTGSGTIPATQAVMDSLIGFPGGTRITSLWPGRAIIDFTSVDAMRVAKSRRSLIDSVLPGMFAAGIDYELILPFLDVIYKAAVKGNAEKVCLILAAVATQAELSCGIDALIAYGRELSYYTKAAIAQDQDAFLPIKATVRAERLLEPGILSAIQGEPELPVTIYAAILAERELSCLGRAAIMGVPELPCIYYAAIAHNFERQCGILARIVFMYELASGIKAAVQVGQELSVGIRARVARSL
jgi:hypothetical protein